MDNQNGARQPYTPITPPSWGAMACKRAFDIVCSLLGLVVLSPLLLVVSLLVAVTSPGGVFFRQERIGKGGKPFRIFKFRSMRKDNAGLKITPICGYICPERRWLWAAPAMGARSVPSTPSWAFTIHRECRWLTAALAFMPVPRCGARIAWPRALPRMKRVWKMHVPSAGGWR